MVPGQLLNSSLVLTHPQKVYEYTAGGAGINNEIFPVGNDSFVLHVWNSYESGEVENFRILTEFIGHRTGNASMGDRLHAIWYAPPFYTYDLRVNANRLCIATPFTGGRILEVGEEEIFRVVYGKGVLSCHWGH